MQGIHLYVANVDSEKQPEMFNRGRPGHLKRVRGFRRRCRQQLRRTVRCCSRRIGLISHSFRACWPILGCRCLHHTRLAFAGHGVLHLTGFAPRE